MAWTIADVVGWSLGWAFGGLRGERVGGPYSFAAAALLSTALESLVLRSIVPNTRRWILLSLAGIVFGIALSVALDLPLGAVLLLFAQWMFFVPAYRRAGLWLLAGLAGVVAAGAAAIGAYLAIGGQMGAPPAQGPSGPLLGLFLGALFGLIIGALRAFALARILSATKEATYESKT